MKIKKSELITMIREVITEESEYRAYFNKVAKQKGINLSALDKLSAGKKTAFFTAVDKGWKAKNEKDGDCCKEGNCCKEAYMDEHDCKKVHPGKSHKEWKKMEETLEFQPFAKGHSGDRLKAKKRQQILRKPEVQEAKRVKLTTEAIRKMIREELTFLMYNEKPSTKGFKRAKRNKKLSGDVDLP